MKAGRTEEAERSLEAAREVIEDEDGDLPLAESLLGWLRSRLHVTGARVTAEQERHRYFAVRREHVSASRAVALPDAWLAGRQPLMPEGR